MPVKLIGTIIMLVAITIFCGFNIGDEYSCNINFVFRKFENIPVFITILVSFLCGSLVVLPFTIRFGRKKKVQEKPVAQTPPKQPQEDSKTLFDFKIKRETKNENSSAKKSSSTQSSDAETGAPI